MARMARPRSVIFFIDSGGFGGAEKALLTLIRGLDRDRWRPALIVDQGVTAKPLAEGAADASCELIQARAMPEGVVGARRAVGFAAALRARRPDVFHAHLTWPLACKFGLAAAVGARVPAVVATHQLIPPFVLRRRALVQQRLLGSMVGRQIAVSEDIAVRLVDLFGWPRQRITVVHNGVPVPTERPKADAVLRAQLLAGQRAVVLVPARLDALKGHEFLLEAVRELEHVQVVVAGDGPERAKLEGLADRLGVRRRVTFLGFREDMPRLIACADVVVLPSLSEGLPLAVLEAMAAGTPLVATAIGGSDEAVVDGVTGLLVPARDAAALAHAVERVLAHPEEARRRAEAAAGRVAGEFSAETMVARVESVYEELLIGRERRARR